MECVSLPARQPTFPLMARDAEAPEDASMWGGGVVLVGALGLLVTDQLDRRRKRKRKATTVADTDCPDEWFADDERSSMGDEDRVRYVPASNSDSGHCGDLAASQSRAVGMTTPDELTSTTVAATRDKQMLCEEEVAPTPVEPQHDAATRGVTPRPGAADHPSPYTYVPRRERGWSWRMPRDSRSVGVAAGRRMAWQRWRAARQHRRA